MGWKEKFLLLAANPLLFLALLRGFPHPQRKGCRGYFILPLAFLRRPIRNAEMEENSAYSIYVLQDLLISRNHLHLLKRHPAVVSRNFSPSSVNRRRQRRAKNGLSEWVFLLGHGISRLARLTLEIGGGKDPIWVCV